MDYENLPRSKLKLRNNPPHSTPLPPHIMGKLLIPLWSRAVEPGKKNPESRHGLLFNVCLPSGPALHAGWDHVRPPPAPPQVTAICNVVGCRTCKLVM